MIVNFVEKAPTPRFVPGVCDFVIDFAEETISKAGNPTLKLTVTVTDTNGAQVTLRNWLSPKAPWIVKKFLQATGIPAGEEEIDLTEQDCIGKSGQALVGYERSKTDYKDYLTILQWGEAVPSDATDDEAFPAQDLPF